MALTASDIATARTEEDARANDQRLYRAHLAVTAFEKEFVDELLAREVASPHAVVVQFKAALRSLSGAY